jgi:AcrR family transcriptional regulator
MSTPSRALRSDGRRNRQHLLSAAGELLHERAPASIGMAMIAQRAQVSTATAYRHFSTVEALLNAYLVDVMAQLRDYSHDSPQTGIALFHDVIAEWGRLLERYGEAMVLLRSELGLLVRLANADVAITTMREAWERPLRAVLRHTGSTEVDITTALFLYNVIFDPREVLDLVRAGLSMPTALANLTAAYFGALRGWATGGRSG